MKFILLSSPHLAWKKTKEILTLKKQIGYWKLETLSTSFDRKKYMLISADYSDQNTV